MSHVINHTDVLIEDGNTEATTLVDTFAGRVAGIVVPTGFEGTAITFEASDDEAGTFLPCHDDTGTEISVTVAAGRHVLVDPNLLAGARWVKLVAGTAQTGDITLRVAMRVD